MKNAFVLAVLMLVACQLMAQNPTDDRPKYKTSTRDTINIRGYVYNYDGSTASNVGVTSCQPDTIWDYWAGFRLGTVTDANGFFKINGAKFNDKLKVGPKSFINNGSRFMVIYLPPQDQMIGSISIRGRRTQKKPTVTYKIKHFDGIVDAWELDAHFPGGLDNFKKMLMSKIAYPKAAIENNIEGTIELRFVILRDGSPGDIKVLRGLGYGCEEAAIQAFKNTPRWSPGIRTPGRPSEQTFIIDVEFKLTD